MEKTHDAGADSDLRGPHRFLTYQAKYNITESPNVLKEENSQTHPVSVQSPDYLSTSFCCEQQAAGTESLGLNLGITLVGVWAAGGLSEAPPPATWRSTCQKVLTNLPRTRC